MAENHTESIEARVIRLVIDQLCSDKQPTPEVNRDTSFVNDLDADSLDTVELVMALEEEFDLQIVDEAAENITTVGDAVDYIENAAADNS